MSDSYAAYLKRFRPDADPVAYQRFRDAVLTRDKHRCVWCGKPGTHVDHVLRWKTKPSERYNPVNGRTLCRTCHRKRHCLADELTDGRLANTPETETLNSVLKAIHKKHGKHHHGYYPYHGAP